MSGNVRRVREGFLLHRFEELDASLVYRDARNLFELLPPLQRQRCNIRLVDIEFRILALQRFTLLLQFTFRLEDAGELGVQKRFTLGQPLLVLGEFLAFGGVGLLKLRAELRDLQRGDVTGQLDLRLCFATTSILAPTTL